jgi:hypothetical protein
MEKTTLPRETLEATLPSGKKIVLHELTGSDELAVAAEIGEATGLRSEAFALWGSVLRSLRSIDGARFDASAHTPESVRNLFGARDWQCVVAAFAELHRPSREEGDAFRKSFRRSAA